MTPVIDFFKTLKADIIDVAELHEENQRIPDGKIASIALRIFGSLLALGTAAFSLARVTVLGGSAMAALSLLITSALLAVLAHDTIQVGLNINASLFAWNRTVEYTFKDTLFLLPTIHQIDSCLGLV